MVCGSSAAGKTNFVNLLLEKEFKIKHEPTGVTDPKDTMVKEVMLKENNEDVVKFNICDCKYQKLILMSHLYHNQFHKNESNFTDQLDRSDFVTDSRQLLNQDVSENKSANVSIETKMYDSRAFTNTQLEHKKSSSDNIVVTSSQQSKNLLPVHKSYIEENLEEILRHIEILPRTWNMLTFLDTGGQPEYISMLPAINNSVLVTFIVLNLEYDLFAKVTVFNGGDSTYSLPYDYIGLIEMLISMRKPPTDNISAEIFAKRGEKRNYLSIIGTKSDVVESDPKKDLDTLIDDIDKILQGHLKVACVPDMLTFKGGKFITPVSNCNAGKSDEDNNAKIIRRKLYEKLQESAPVYHIPISWLLLELEIKDWCIKNGRKYIKLQEIKSVFIKIHSFRDSKDYLNFLKVYHILGVFLYYGIDGVVITDVQWFYKNISKLVSFSTMSEERHDYKKLLQQGLATNRIFQKMKFDVSEDLKLDFFIKVFELLNIMAIYSTDQEEKYFVPCILSTCDLHSVETKDSLKEIGCDHGEEPLLVQLSTTEDCTDKFAEDLYYGFPKGIFCSLVTYLVKREKTDDDHLTLLLSPKYLHSNLIIFQYFIGDDDEKYNIVLLDRYTYLEIQIRCEKQTNTVYHRVRGLILNSLAEVVANLEFSANNIWVAFRCRECKEEFHLTRNKIQKIIDKVPFHCLSNAAADKKYLKSVWFEDCFTQVCHLKVSKL